MSDVDKDDHARIYASMKTQLENLKEEIRKIQNEGFGEQEVDQFERRD